MSKAPKVGNIKTSREKEEVMCGLAFIPILGQRRGSPSLRFLAYREPT